MKLSLAGNKPGAISLNKGKQPARPLSSNTLSGKATASSNGKKPAAFGNDEDEDEDDARRPSTSTGAGKSKLGDPTRPGVNKSSNGNPSRLLKKMHEEAAAHDPNVFAYDEVYDSMKAGAVAAAEAKKANKDADKPKYVSQLLKAAEIRKNDRIRAEDKLIEREREKEGDQYADRDSFVTDAYKQQQEELRRAEEEERKREEEASKRPGGMAEYYKRELARQEAVHAAAVAAAQSNSGAAPVQLSAEAAELAAHGPKSEEQLAAEASKELGRRIEVNQEGQIVDKRELLTGGLNVKPRKVQGPASGPPKGFALSIQERKSQQEEIERLERERKAREDEASLGMTGMTMAERQKASRERQAREIERQMKELESKKRKAEEEQREELAKKVTRRNNDESKVEELKRKALERRLAREAEEKRKADEAKGSAAVS